MLAIVLLRLHLPVGALPWGSAAAVLGLLFSKGPVEILVMFVRTLIEPKTLMIAAIVTLILYFSGSMAKLGQMSTLLGHFRQKIGGNRLGLISFPSLIGLLPMPGGAVFSAPMLEAFDRDNQGDTSSQKLHQLLVPPRVGVLVAAVSRRDHGVARSAN